MKNKTNTQKNQVKTPAKPSLARPAFLTQMNLYLAKNRYWVMGSLVVLFIIVRASLLNTVVNGPLYQLYSWQESDSYFFDQQARALEAGDWLNRQPLHPYHGWHREIADHYFKQHPDKLNQILAANPGRDRDTTFVPGKTLWNEWYGGNTYHQEPLYAYILAILYALTGNGIYWMIVLQAIIGMASGLLLWQITRRFFDDTTALFTGLLYALCGIVLFQEALILRTSWSVFFTLLTLWALQRALDKGTARAFLLSGITIGLAYLLQSFFVLFLVGAVVIYIIQEQKLSKTIKNYQKLSFKTLDY